MEDSGDGTVREGMISPLVLPMTDLVWRRSWPRLHFHARKEARSSVPSFTLGKFVGCIQETR